MHTVRIYRLTHLSPTLFGRLKAAQMEGAQVCNCCCELHKQARTTHSKWPGQGDLQQATKGRFALHSQSDYLTHKSKQAHIMSFTGSERGTSSRCPVCEHRHKPKGRVWRCKRCRFTGHRDIVGSVNMHRLAYDQQVTFPRAVTYLRPGEIRRSSRADTLHAF